MVENILQLAKISLVPVVASVAMHYLRRTKTASSNNETFRQIFAGLLFGGICIICNEWGVTVNGVIMNVRDAAPLCAAFICGWPAGIIAGVIGGIWRWVCVYWGGGTYTRIACTAATILAGLIGSFYRRKVCENKTPSILQAGLIAVTVETIHMMLVFFTHINDATHAFDIVKACSIPMIIANAFSVMLAVGINKLYHLKEKKEKTAPDISAIFQQYLLIVLIIAFGFTIFSVFKVQSGISKKNYTSLLNTGISDVINSIDDMCDDELLKKTRQIVQVVDCSMSTDELMRICEEYGVDEISVISKEGILETSSNKEFVGYDMFSGQQSQSFMECMEQTDEYVQPYQPIAKDSSISRKYAGIRIGENRIIQVGYSPERFQSSIRNEIMLGVANRHVGTKGKIIVATLDGVVVCDSEGEYGYRLADIGLSDFYTANEEMNVFVSSISQMPHYCMYASREGYYIISTISLEEVETPNEASVYMTSFMNVLIMGAIYTQAYFLVKILVVDNVRIIGRDLKKITEGKLNTRVDVHQSSEFIELSTGINATVDRLKEYISEAEKRIETELQYAKDIQSSSLPSEFPAFPAREDFDIYATMSPAKTVGGDFYDFYLIDNDRLAIMIADVSGKGIPAALFMMRAKALLKTYTTYNVSVEDVFTYANGNLCEGNDAEMFVTAWLGILDLKNGLMEFANAGHNPPAIKREGRYEFLSSKPGFVLAGMEGIIYKKQTVQIQPGDEIYLYTDGVTESINSEKEQFGNERLLQVLNGEGNNTCEEICMNVAKAVDEFVKDEDQFDDITMLSLKYIEKNQ